MNLNNIKFPPALFVTGIGTDVGKSFVTGLMAKAMVDAGLNTITQKLVQTGCTNSSEDIECHRKIMGIPNQDVDDLHLTAPEIFTYPASPHLAAKIDRRQINLEKIHDASTQLLKEYDYLLIEGAGGLMVPLNDEMLTIDYIKLHNLPVVLTTNGRLGSISDTLLNLDVIARHGIKLFAVVYNSHFDYDKTIAEDTYHYLESYLTKYFPDTFYLKI